MEAFIFQERNRVRVAYLTQFSVFNINKIVPCRIPHAANFNMITENEWKDGAKASLSNHCLKFLLLGRSNLSLSSYPYYLPICFSYDFSSDWFRRPQIATKWITSSLPPFFSIIRMICMCPFTKVNKWNRFESVRKSVLFLKYTIIDWKKTVVDFLIVFTRLISQLTCLARTIPVAWFFYAHLSGSGHRQVTLKELGTNRNLNAVDGSITSLWPERDAIIKLNTSGVF